MQNPFTSTYSKAPEYTYILTDEVGEIYQNFSFDSPTESVYKITGVRGSGKTVILAKIEEELQREDNRKMGWLVCRLTASRDMLLQLGAILAKNNLQPPKADVNGVTLSADFMGFGGEIDIAKNPIIRDLGIEVESMIINAQKKGLKIFVGIDEISKNKEVIDFVGEFGKWLRSGYPVYMVCTGLYENMQEVANVKNLTFFRRATTVQTKPLSLVKMAEMYKDKLSVDSKKAKEMADITKGYAYAFQEFGLISFRDQEKCTFDEILHKLKVELYSYSYEKIWEELTDNDRFFIRAMSQKDEYKREELIRELGDKAGMYSVYRDRLMKRGIINVRYSYLSFALPFFGEYVREYCLEDY